MAEAPLEMSVYTSDMQHVVEAVQIPLANPFNPDSSPDLEPIAKKPRISVDTDTNQQSIKQLLFNINKAICLRLDGLESKLETVLTRTRTLEEKIEILCTQLPVQFNSSPTRIINTTIASQDAVTVTRRPGPVVVGVPTRSSLSPTGSSITTTDQFGTYEPERYAIVGPGTTEQQVLQKMYPDNMPGMGQNITLITLNSEDDYPNGTWLGDENNPEMRVRVPVTPSDLLHIHSNCRTAEKMALTLLDYLFDRETQACSNLSGMGKHGKRQLDPLLIYGVRCHLIHRFAMTEQDWHRIKQNVDSKCRTAFRRKQRGLPLTVKAFRGKSPAANSNSTNALLGYHQGLHGMHDLSSHSDDDSMHQEEGQLHIQSDQMDAGDHVVMTPITHITHNATGEIQVLHATPEQVAQLQQTHQIQILQGDQVIGHLGRNNLNNDIQVTVSLPNDASGLQQIVAADHMTQQNHTTVTTLMAEDEEKYNMIKAETDDQGVVM